MGAPSVTSQVVALTRIGLDRPSTPDGDPDAQGKLCAGMRVSPPAWLQPSIAARTEFIDEELVSAIAAGLRQVVICGAGYDDRAHRFRTAGVQFFELDHPDTQADKAMRLRDIGTAAAVTLVPADFRTDSVGALLARAGHDPRQPSLFLCEGLLIYLDRHACHRLLAALAGRAAPGSALAATLATHADGPDSAEVVAAANKRRRTAAAEPWQTILPVAEHLALLAAAGWVVTGRRWSPPASADVSYGRRTLLVRASRIAR
ncbi:MAG TPA: class I SAM-dependent methyltransferase [Streptosporangiaceae bacterium]|nr:class I SAM-dependent methyltransferase [Streptosporangiaceae bacterium]